MKKAHYKEWIWIGDFMYSELIGEDYELEENPMIGLYFKNIESNEVIYVNYNKNTIIEL